MWQSTLKKQAATTARGKMATGIGGRIVGLCLHWEEQGRDSLSEKMLSLFYHLLAKLMSEAPALDQISRIMVILDSQICMEN